MNNMKKDIKNNKVIGFFEEISKIPRGSYNEKAIADYLVSFANERALACVMDDSNNVLIIKNSTQGRENEPALLLQAHTDMVCEKNNCTKHDFSTDPISLIYDGDILRADGTTLGADDGFGVAIMLSLLDSDISCPRLECLFTSAEEVGLVGASAFDYSHISAKRMINLDSAEEDTVIIGCCGGVRTELSVPVDYEDAQCDGYKITVSGLCGGHSGEDIDRSRLNAHILMGRLLTYISESSDIRIAYIGGGDKDNAIPRECEAIFVSNGVFKLSEDEINGYARTFIKANEDEALTVTLTKCPVNRVFSEKGSKDLLSVLSIPNGVLRYRSEEPILPEISRNLARIRTTDEGYTVGFSSRCYFDEGLVSSTDYLDVLAESVGGATHHHERYPGWQSKSTSALIDAYKCAYRSIYDKEVSITLIHAGLECGIITNAVGNMDAISVGCNIYDLHTPNERMEISSLLRIYFVISNMIEGGQK